MNKFSFFLIIFNLFLFITYGQELTCKDFKLGKFVIPEAHELKNYTIKSKYSTYVYEPENDSATQRYIVIREKNKQIEWRNGIGNGNPEYEIIEWIDECTYRLTFDESKHLDNKMKWINSNNGLLVSKTKIEGKCLFYRATMTLSTGQEISQDGVICKE